MLACYNLREQQASFDYFQWLVTAKTRGATSVRLHVAEGIKKKNAKYDAAEGLRRYENIIKPGAVLAGLESTEGPLEGERFYHGIGGVIKTYQEIGSIKKLKGVLPVGGYKYTVTLRNAAREQRNSNVENWLKFAKAVDAFVIQDYRDKPIGLHERMALYEGAEMNYMVSNGPAILCILSEAPCAILKIAPEAEGSGSAKFLESEGLPKGTQYSWFNNRQRLFWCDDTYENICKAHEEMNARAV